MATIQVLPLYENTTGISREHENGRPMSTFFFIDPSHILTEDIIRKWGKHISDLSKPPPEVVQTHHVMDHIVEVMKSCSNFYQLVGDHQMLGLGFGEFRQVYPHDPFIIDSPDDTSLTNPSNLIVVNVIKEPPEQTQFPFPWINIGYYDRSRRMGRDIVLDDYENFWELVVFRPTHMNPLFGRVMIPNLPSTRYRRQLSLLLIHRNSDTYGITDNARGSLLNYSDFLLQNPQFCDGGFTDKSIDDM